MNHTSFTADIPLPGNHMILNAMAAASVGALLHMTSEEIKAGIEAVQPVGGRSHIIRHEKRTIIDDCYNANPVSMKAAIDLLSMADSRKLAILGDMFELGSKENDLHKEVGSYAASSGIDVLICVGSLSINMYESAMEVLQKVREKSSYKTPERKLIYFKTREELIASLPGIINENDTILVKASHGMGFDEVVKALQK
jgi:UDP-N-acetylmuramoyl-tripeptide--D-alanyl-D-alanine ligase